ncbi:hypothetical protein DPEC_G00302790 [Dallia pectoralis]|uniref:Uncharacterized protein n=1 Tax=Dallia pectoralis TaxID=75939 RepID=A0ACC2FH20_DALPE|nr:hypothetical protein DPEC_G00302790 [Dallia pectoralis]
MATPPLVSDIGLHPDVVIAAVTSLVSGASVFGGSITGSQWPETKNVLLNLTAQTGSNQKRSGPVHN